MKLSRLYAPIGREIASVLRKVPDPEFVDLYNEVMNAERIFVAGMGRSGLVGQMFAMRLMHLGLRPFIIGETTTPRMEKDDLLIAISGTGESRVTTTVAKAARTAKTKVVAVTTARNSLLGRTADKVVVIPVRMSAGRSGESSIQPLGTLFEQSVFIFLDLLVLYIIRRTGKKEAGLIKRHIQL